MEVENKLKAMGLELPAAAPPPPGRLTCLASGTHSLAISGNSSVRPGELSTSSGVGERFFRWTKVISDLEGLARERT